MRSTEETISAWLDGTLSASEAEAFEMAMRNDPQLAETVARLRRNDATLGSAFPLEPVSDAMLSQMGLARGVESAASSSNVISLPADRLARKRRSLPTWQWSVGAAAASIAAAVLVFPLFQQNVGSGIEQVVQFQEALQTGASVQDRSLGDGRTVTPTLSFAAGDGRYCREFVVREQASAFSGIACRQADTWVVEAIAEGGPPAPAAGQIYPASGATAVGLEAAHRRLQTSDPFSRDRESTLIAQGWRN